MAPRLGFLSFPERPNFLRAFALRASAARIAGIGLRNLFQVSPAEREQLFIGDAGGRKQSYVIQQPLFHRSANLVTVRAHYAFDNILHIHTLIRIPATNVVEQPTFQSSEFLDRRWRN
jgi:hypothetical protein